MERTMTILSATLLTFSVLLGSTAAFAQSSSKSWKKPYRYSYLYYNTYRPQAFWRGSTYAYQPFVFYPPAPFGFGDIAALRAFTRMP